MKYNDKFDPDQQVTLEERIAAIIYDEAETTRGNDNVSDDSAIYLGKEILKIVVAELRPDLVAKKWKISDGNVTEIYEDWDELISAAEGWYNFVSENDWTRDVIFPEADLDDIEEGDLVALNDYIRAWEEKIAQAAGYKDFAGHGGYAVSAASEMGLNLTVREEEETE